MTRDFFKEEIDGIPSVTMTGEEYVVIKFSFRQIIFPRFPL
jgi:hypothetical protein